MDRLEFFLEHECKGLNLDPILVGVSGGPDSLCLLDVLVKAKRPVIVAHFNHLLRPESDQEAEHVKHMAQHYGLPFVTGSQDVKAFASKNGFSLEEAARKLRYRFLFAQAHKLGAMVIAVAHQADDQVETVLMHFLRGAGLNGLKGMIPVTLLPEFDPEIRLIRPLLRTWRKDIEAYCETHKLDTVEDLTNLDQTYFRNRLRHSLIPTMETYNPG
ncbi:MAG: tRNA lysidine(34) synthetase TilS, partial [Chloroflexota bacterium]